MSITNPVQDDVAQTGAYRRRISCDYTYARKLVMPTRALINSNAVIAITYEDVFMIDWHRYKSQNVNGSRVRKCTHACNAMIMFSKHLPASKDNRTASDEVGIVGYSIVLHTKQRHQTAVCKMP